MLLPVAIAGAVLQTLGAPSCTAPSDCSHNGVCVSGVCQCAPQWTGQQCDSFRFAPLDPAAGVGLQTVTPAGTRVSSWGGSVLRDDSGTYHMWAAEMTDSVGIKAWITNSQVVHAVADAPDTPFRFRRREVVFPTFAHEPTVARAPTGEYVMFFTTNFGEAPGSQCNPPCTCGHNGTSCLSCPNDQQCHANPRSPLSTRMSWAATPDGPWSSPVLIPAPTAGDTNLACVIQRNSSLICLGRPSLGLLRADNWRNVSDYSPWQRTQGTPIQGEDPMLWLDPTETVLHAVTHGGGWGQPWGYHYWSDDRGTTWHGTGNRAYSNMVELVGAVGGGETQKKILSRRERPHVVLDEHSALIGLTNGVTEAWPCTLQREPDRPPCKHPTPPGTNPSCGPGSNGTSIWCPDDYCYTLFQLFARA